MAIHWFPGHMNKAKREIAKVMGDVDFVIELVDARVPYSSANPMLRQLRRDRPCLKVLNKSDLADPETTAVWIDHLQTERGVRAVAMHQGQRKEIRALLKIGRTLLPADRNTQRPVTAMIVGIPNVGKSTMINILADRVLAKTGNVPAVTRRQQRISLGGGMVLVDTPGILWPRLSPPECGYRLALTGAIKDNQFDYLELAMFTADFMRRRYPQALMKRYKLPEMPDGPVENVLNAIAARRGCLGKGGVPDLHRVSELLIHEYRQGLFGLVSLELPEDIAREAPAPRSDQ